jgi:hypothetical protein
MKFRIALLSAVMAIAAFAADVSGKWTAETPGRGGQPMTFTLKADGSALTGSVSGRGGDTPITDGKIDGDTVSFTVVREMQGNTMKMMYTGKVSGDSINFKMTREGADQAREFTAKRSTT